MNNYIQIHFDLYKIVGTYLQVHNLLTLERVEFCVSVVTDENLPGNIKLRLCLGGDQIDTISYLRPKTYL